MASGAIALPIYPGRMGGEPPESEAQVDDESFVGELNDETDGDEVEGRGLLSPSSRPARTKSQRTARARRRRTNRVDEAAVTAARSSLACAGIFVVASALIFIVFPAFLPETTHHHTGMLPQHDVRFSNGTHQFRKTVLMVSIDGLRYEISPRVLLREPLLTTATAISQGLTISIGTSLPICSTLVGKAFVRKL